MISQWKDYRRRLISFFVAWFGGFLFVWVASVTLSAAGFVIILPFVAWFVAFCLTALWLQRFPCPRCGKPFLHPVFYGRERHKFLDMRQCIHCGLRSFGDPQA
jgi:hypothetical protein